MGESVPSGIDEQLALNRLSGSPWGGSIFLTSAPASTNSFPQ
jgi:hypothetical protein